MTIKVSYTYASPVYINIGYGAVDGGAVWGDITGTLSNQADLQAALNAKVPYSGATGNVNLGEYELKAGQLTFDTSPTGTATVATMRWNDTTGLTETTLKGGSVVLKNGVDLVARVVNKVSPNTTLTKAAYQAVRVSGAQGQRLAVAFAQANNDNNSADTIGLVTETIATNQEGFIMTVGQLEGINTTGSLQGETWVDGDVLYLSPTTAGALTNVKPVAPQHLVIIGYVEYAHPNNGKIYVKVMNGWELGELHDVNTTGATNGSVLKYNGSIWVPSSDIDTGITTLNTLTALSQSFATGTSGTDFNISSATSTHTFNLPSASATNRGLLTSADWSTFNGKENVLTFSSPLSRSINTISIPQATGSVNGFLSSTDWTTFNNKQNALTNPITGTGASGQVAYWSGTNTQTGSNNLFWDNTNSRLGIGTNAPAQALQVNGSARILTTGTGGLFLEATSGTETPNLIFLSTTNRYNLDNSSGTLRFFRENTDGTSGAVRMSLTDGGNLLIGTSSDNTRRLQVAGDGYFSGNLILEPTSGTDTPNLTFLSTTNRYNIDALNGTLRFFRENSDGTSGAVRMSLTDGGNLLLGSGTDSGQRLQVTGDGYFSGSVGIGSTSPTSASLRLSKTIAGTGGTFGYGILQEGVIQSNVTSFSMGFYNLLATQAASFTLNNYYHFFAQQSTIGAGSAVNNQYGYFVQNTLTGATNNYGFYGDIASGTGRWNLYMNGTADNYLAGSLGIGATSLSGISLGIAKSMTGATVSRAIHLFGTVQSDVTIFATGFSSKMNVASGFTLPSLVHFYSDQGTISGTLTNQYGFAAESTLIGATNNYGFFGSIPAGTGRWNLYMNGTAANYLGGNLWIGTTSGNHPLEVASAGNTILYIRAGATSLSRLVFGTSTNTDRGFIDYDNTAASRNMSFKIAEVERMRLDASGNLGLGVTPSAWGSNTAFQIGNGAIWKSGSRSVDWITNGYYNGTNYIYNQTAAATYYRQYDGSHQFWNAPSGTAGNAITFTQAMTLDASGNLALGIATASSRVHIDAAAGSAHIRVSEAGTTRGFVGGANGIATGRNGYFMVRGEAGLVLSGNGNSADIIINPTTANVQIGGTTDAGFKLDVNGTMRVSGASTLTGAATFNNTVTFNGSTTFNSGAVIRSDNGTAAAPSISFDSDLDTGIYRIAANTLGIATGGVAQFTIASTGAATFTSSVTAADFRLSALNTAPATASSTGTLGEIRIDANYIYICTATNTWKRVAIATW